MYSQLFAYVRQVQPATKLHACELFAHNERLRSKGFEARQCLRFSTREVAIADRLREKKRTSTKLGGPA